MFLLIGFLAGLLTAGAAERVLQPSAQPGDVTTLYADFARSRGRFGLAAIPACRPFAERLSLCFNVQEGGRRRMATLEDLSLWKTDLERVEAEIVARTAAQLSVERLSVQTVDGMDGRYWLSARKDGDDAAGLLHPEKLVEISGGAPVVAVPAKDTLLFWLPGDADFDKVVAVGVRRMYDKADHPVSPLIYRWENGRWKVWGQARTTGL